MCRGPVRPGFARCYQCGRHALLGHALLADAVVPISYAIRGTGFADDLWRYKSGRAALFFFFFFFLFFFFFFFFFFFLYI